MKKIQLLILPFLLSSFVLYLSFDTQLWLTFWRTLNIPAAIPPFSDLDSITKTLLSKSGTLEPRVSRLHRELVRMWLG